MEIMEEVSVGVTITEKDARPAVKTSRKLRILSLKILALWKVKEMTSKH